MRTMARMLALLLALLCALTACAALPEQAVQEDVHLELVTEAETPEQSEPEEAGTAEPETARTDEPEEARTPDLPADSDEGREDLPESGEYTSRDDVARYLYLYGHLPGNFITKSEARALGWVSSKGNLGEVAPGKSIGGDRFGNYEGILPQGRTYRECDIDTDGSYRGAKRIVWSGDGLIYYTEDHYEHFTLLYGEE